MSSNCNYTVKNLYKESANDDSDTKANTHNEVTDGNTTSGQLTEILDGTLTEPKSNTDLENPDQFGDLQKHAKSWAKDTPKKRPEVSKSPKLPKSQKESQFLKVLEYQKGKILVAKSSDVDETKNYNYIKSQLKPDIDSTSELPDGDPQMKTSGACKKDFFLSVNSSPPKALSNRTISETKISDTSWTSTDAPENTLYNLFWEDIPIDCTIYEQESLKAKNMNR